MFFWGTVIHACILLRSVKRKTMLRQELTAIGETVKILNSVWGAQKSNGCHKCPAAIDDVKQHKQRFPLSAVKGWEPGTLQEGFVPWQQQGCFEMLCFAGLFV